MPNMEVLQYGELGRTETIINIYIYIYMYVYIYILG